MLALLALTTAEALEVAALILEGAIVVGKIYKTITK